jgi:hypothetical protein
VVASTDLGRTSVRLWNFSGYNSAATKAIPPFGSKDRMQWYQDSVYLSRRAGRAILDTVVGFPPSELSKDLTFGVQVTPATNIEEYFERRRIDRERYLAANPEIEPRDCRAWGVVAIVRPLSSVASHHSTRT